MSLDAYLYAAYTKQPELQQPTIWIRRGGQTVAITREEWDELYPDREPVICSVPAEEREDGLVEVYHANITHNLTDMAKAVGRKFYQSIWRPEELGVTKAGFLVSDLLSGLVHLQTYPDKYRPLNPENGWGSYEVLVSFTWNYLQACRQWPEAKIEVCR